MAAGTERVCPISNFCERRMLRSWDVPPEITTQPPADAYAKLLSLASHEFRTPASVVGGYLRMLQHDTESALSDRQRKMINEAEKSCTRIVALLGEMSELARLEGGTAALGHAPFDLFAALTDVAGNVRESQDRGVEMELRGASTGALISGDATRVKEAFAALFRAVLREQPGSCTVVADRRVETGRAAVAIANQSEIERVWATPPATFNEHRGGLGLALPIARRVVEHAGGRVSSVFAAAVTGSSTPQAGAILVSFDLEQKP